MTSIKLFGAALVRSAIALAPVSAQEAIQAPGAYSFYHPKCRRSELRRAATL